MKPLLLTVAVSIATSGCASLRTPAPVGRAEVVASASAELPEGVDMETWHGVYQQVLDAASRDSFLSIAMIKDLPRGQIEDMETFIDFERPSAQNTPLSASVARASGHSIYSQLYDLIESKKGKTLSELVPLLEIEEFTLIERECPPLRASYRRLTDEAWSFQAAPEFSDTIMISIHPRMYVLSSAVSGHSLRVVVYPQSTQYARVKEAFDTLAPCLIRKPAT